MLIAKIGDQLKLIEKHPIRREDDAMMIESYVLMKWNKCIFTYYIVIIHAKKKNKNDKLNALPKELIKSQI